MMEVLHLLASNDPRDLDFLSRDAHHAQMARQIICDRAVRILASPLPHDYPNSKWIHGKILEYGGYQGLDELTTLAAVQLLMMHCTVNQRRELVPISGTVIGRNLALREQLKMRCLP
jgi:hypothetical protein